jgi:hypothetical protein
VLFIPILSLFVILLKKAKDNRVNVQIEDNMSKSIGEIVNSYANATTLKTVAIILNIVLLGYACWAVFQPHPAEEGYIPYVIVVLLAPIINITILLGIGPKNRETI